MKENKSIEGIIGKSKNIEDVFSLEAVKSQKQYDKVLSGIEKDLALSYGDDGNMMLFLKKIFGGENLITKEDIMRMDAELQSKAIDEVKKGVKGAEEKLEKMKNSNLWRYDIRSGDYVNPDAFDIDNNYENGIKLIGTINGQKVYIYASKVFGRKNENTPEYQYFGELNEKEILPEDAEKIFNMYNDIASERTKVVVNSYKIMQKIVEDTKVRSKVPELEQVLPKE